MTVSTTDINGEILRTIQKIRETHPELLKYLDEMPLTVASGTITSIKITGLKNYYDSLKQLLDDYAHESESIIKTLVMKEKAKSVQPAKQETKTTEIDFPDYPSSPIGEDVYTKWEELKEVDPENPTLKKARKNKNAERALGSGLDVPGSELDDEQERIGSEDEENNYYSLGGDDHNDLDEDNDE